MNKNINYPHLDSSNYGIKTKLSYCLNVYQIPNTNERYQKELDKLVRESWYDNLNNSSKENPVHKNNAIRDLIADNKSGNSMFWFFKVISNEDKIKHDNFLKNTRYSKKIDKNAYYTEGCMNEKETFIGGSKEMINFFCTLFPTNETCQNLFKRVEGQGVENKLAAIFDRPETSDLFISKILENSNPTNI